ncbi:MAG: NHLP family bacteriocin export ABC transporter peptidase/permease/ATPase subunit [Cyanobacteria bacterium P01_B01_bin.77]
MTLLKRSFQRFPRVKTPTLIQMEAVECGAAALGIILAFFGKIVPLSELRQACGVSRDGSKASNIVRAAQRYGLEAKGFKESLESLRGLPVPFIVFWQFNHFLVVEGWNRNTVFLNDPASGPRKVSWSEFDEGFTGVVLVMKPGESFVRGGRKPSLWLALTRQIQRSPSAWIYIVLMGFLLVIPGLVMPVFRQVFVDQILIGGQQDWLRPLILGLAITTIVRALLRGLQLWRLRDLNIKLSVGMNSQFLWHILRLPVQFYDQRFAGEISARLGLNTRVSSVVAGQLSTTVIDGVMLIFYVAIMATYDWGLTLVGIGVALINLLVLQWVARQRVDSNLRLNQDLGKLSGVEISGLQSIETLKATASESDFFTRWSGTYAKCMNAQQDLSLTSLRVSLLPPLLSAITTMLILVLGGFRVIDGVLSIGMLIAFQSLMGSFQKPVQTLVGFGQQLQTLESDLYRLNDVLNNPIDETLAEDAEAARAHDLDTPIKGRLEFKQVTFGYSRVSPPLLENFNFVLEPGKRIALVGGSGSGKSTIAKLAAGLYQPWSGEILIDGCPRHTYQPLTLAQSVAMVAQDIFLFGGSVLDNLSLWDPSVPLPDVMQACQDSEIHDAIAALPGGYFGSLMEGGANLSGGQRQRLEIARSLVNNPSLLILDEATSALDAETEKRIDQHLRQRGCACLIVAHRLSTIRDCDEIIVLHQGQVVEQGTHDTLWAQQGYYAMLLQTEEKSTHQGTGLQDTNPLESEATVLNTPAVTAQEHDDNTFEEALVWRGGSEQTLNQYETLLLSHDDRIWRVCSGELDVFAVPSKQHPLAPHRRYLCTLDAKSYVASPAIDELGWCLEIVATETTALEGQTLSEVNSAQRLHCLQSWGNAIATAVGIPAQTWTPDTPWKDQLTVFYHQLTQALDQQATEASQQTRQRLRQKAQLNQNITQEALQTLTNVLRPAQMTVVVTNHNSLLMQAMGAVTHALNLSLNPIRVADQGGKSTDPVEAIALASRFRVRRVALLPNWWRQEAGPLLAFLKAEQTPVALLPSRPGQYDLYNPQTQTRSRLTPELAESLDTVGYSPYRPLPSTSQKHSLFKFALDGQWRTLLIALLSGLTITLLGMLIPQATGLLIDTAIPNADQLTIIQMGAGLSLVAITSTLFRLLQNLAIMRLEIKSDAVTQAALWDHLLTLKLKFFRQFSTGDLQARVSAIRQIRQILSGTTIQTLLSSLVALLNLVLLFVYSQKLAWVALGFTILVVLATMLASVLIRSQLLRQQQLAGELFGFVVQLINGIAKLRVAHAENRAFASWAQRFTPLVRIGIFQKQVSDSLNLFNVVVPSVTNAVIFWLVVDILQQEALNPGEAQFTAGTYLAFNSALGLFMSGAINLSNTLVSALDVLALWGRVKPILEAEPEITPDMSDPGQLQGAIEVERVTFRYRSEGAPILDQVTISVQPGEFVALVGASGAGKSTLLRLLLGFETAETGQILYDGQELQGLDITAVRRQVGVVLQNSKINAASIYNNIAGTARITLAEASQAAISAGLADDIAAMPMGMHTLVSEGGGNLSGGQRQRLIIARALAKSPKLLFFDEATSALDNRTQDIVTQSLENLKVTRIVIAHRLSTVRTADRIFVMERGKVVQSGRFDELASQPGLFRTLMERQRL